MSAPTLARRRIRRLVRISRPAGVRPGAGTATVGHATAPAAVRRRTDRFRRLLRDDAGMSTVEYAIGCIAAAAFAAALYTVVSGESIVTALTQLVQRALTAGY